MSLRSVLALMRVRRPHLARELVQCVVGERIHVIVSVGDWATYMAAVLDGSTTVWNKRGILGWYGRLIGMYERLRGGGHERRIECFPRADVRWRPYVVDMNHLIRRCFMRC